MFFSNKRKKKRKKTKDGGWAGTIIMMFANLFNDEKLLLRI